MAKSRGNRVRLVLWLIAGTVVLLGFLSVYKWEYCYVCGKKRGAVYFVGFDSPLHSETQDTPLSRAVEPVVHRQGRAHEWAVESQLVFWAALIQTGGGAPTLQERVVYMDDDLFAWLVKQDEVLATTALEAILKPRGDHGQRWELWRALHSTLYDWTTWDNGIPFQDPDRQQFYRELLRLRLNAARDLFELPPRPEVPSEDTAEPASASAE